MGDNLSKNPESKMVSASSALSRKDSTLKRQASDFLSVVLSWAPGAALTLFFVFAIRAGLPLFGALNSLLVVAFTQVLPGALLWRLARPREGWWIEDVVAGFAVGAVLAVGAQTLAGLSGIAALAWLPSILLVATVLAIPSSRYRVLAAQTSRLPALWGPAVSGVILLLLIPTQRFYRSVPLQWESGFRQLHTDVPFHLAITGQLAHRGPTELPTVASEPLTYHWFSHAWIAQIGTTGGVELDAVLLRVGPPLTAILLVLAIAVIAVRVTNFAWAGPLAGLIATTSQDLNVFGGTSPFTRGTLLTPVALSLGFSSIIAVVLVGLLSIRWRSEVTSWWSSLMVFALALGAVGAKGSSLPIVIVGALMALLMATFRRSCDVRRILTDFALVSLAFITALLVVFRGAGSTLLDPVASMSRSGISAFFLGEVEEPSLTLIGFAAFLVAASVLARAGGLLCGLAVPAIRRDPLMAFFAGSAVASAGAVVVLSAGGASQYYFLRNGIPIMAIGASMGLVGMWRHLGNARAQSFWLGAVAGLLLVVVQAHAFARITEPDPSLAMTGLVRSGILACVVMAFIVIGVRSQEPSHRLATGVAIVGTALTIWAVVPSALGQFSTPLPRGPVEVDETERFAFSRDQIEAARYLRDHADRRDIVMTNRNCASPVWVNCDSRRFVVAAYTERAVLLEGWGYGVMGQYRPDGSRDYYDPYYNSKLQELNDDFFESPDPQTATLLYNSGVRWIFVDKTVSYSDELREYASPQLETDWALVLKLRDA